MNAVPDRRVRRQLDDPAMVVAKLQLARRAHHAPAFDAADRRDLQGHVAAGDVGARRPEHAEHPGAGIGRAAHDLHRPPSPASTVSTCSLSACGCFSAVSTLATRNGASASAGFDSLLDLQTDCGELVGDLLR